MGPTSLIGDERYQATRFIVIDFEATTPTGHRPEPIDVAAITLHPTGGQLSEVDRFTALMRPPGHAPVTAFDTEQTGITAAMLTHQPPAGVVLAQLDSRLTEPPYLLVAHHAPTEAGILHDYRQHCPTLARIDFLDTVRLARVLYPDLFSHRLDALINHLGLRRPADRHRALPDVEVTAEVFGRLIADGADRGRWRTLRQLRDDGLYEAKAGKPDQQSLF
jgi:DNA polymerase III epsilon subunit-like protein